MHIKKRKPQRKKRIVNETKAKQYKLKALKCKTLGGVEPRIAQPTCVVPRRRGCCTLVLFIEQVPVGNEFD